MTGPPVDASQVTRTVFGPMTCVVGMAGAVGLAALIGWDQVAEEVESLGASVKAQWACLGQYDFINVIEAPDERVMARVSLELGSRGTGRYESLSAIPIDDFIAAL